MTLLGPVISFTLNMGHIGPEVVNLIHSYIINKNVGIEEKTASI